MLKKNFDYGHKQASGYAEKYLKFQDLVITTLKTLRIFGFFPFQMDKDGYISSQLSCRTIIYCSVVYIINLMVTMNAQLDLIWAVQKDKETDFTRYLRIVVFAPQLLGPLPFFLQKQKFVRFFHKWRTFQEEFERTTRTKLQLGSESFGKIVTACIPIIIVSPFLQFTFEDVTTSSIIQATAFSIHIVQEGCLLIYWCLSCGALKSAANQYYRHFIKEVNLAKGYTESIEMCRLLWLALCTTANDFASSVGATFTLTLIYHVLYLILDSYRYCVVIPEQIRNSLPHQMAIVLLDSAIVLAIMFVYCNVGHNIPKYCSKNMLPTILRIKENSLYPSLDDARINIFLFTFEEYVPVVSVSGFYEVNQSLYGGIVSILITYMIVIFQLKDSI